ncbi:MAG: hypothetical protein ABEJ40_12245 [Haloarculaceae archaeon]
MSWRDEFWDWVYDIRYYLRLLLLFLVFLLVLTLFSVALSEPGSTSRSIAYLNALLIGALGAVDGWIYWYSERRLDAE